ncbi:zinc-dependent alcohol dehydrogenase [Aestuariivirga sp.]|uniref:zinc-dependent alcohol dehydrogenase n=1 Tax=Aestuariivirga sp. TaxID=2650926 RepID=UPI00391A890A
MLAVRLHARGDLRVENIERPAQPRSGEVTVRVTAAGICGSDLHNFKTGAWISRSPSVAGHEFTGTISAAGDDVRHVRVGDRVIVDSRYLCGACNACREGRGQVCEKLGFIGEAIDGGFAEAVTLPARNVLKAPEHVPDRHLAMAEPLAVSLHALRRLGAPAGAPLVVTGCGPIGALVALLASRSGHHVTLVDRNERRSARVAGLVAGRVLKMDELAFGSFRHAVETTGHEQVITTLVERIAGCGTIALIGIGRSTPVIDPVRLVEREITLAGCHAFGPELQEAGELLRSLSSQLDAFIAEQIPLRAVPEAYGRHIAGEVDGLKTIILCREPWHGGRDFPEE